MAVTSTFKKEYHVDNNGETTGYNALVADMTDWYDWDEIETGASDTLFKKYQPESSEKWVGIKVFKSTSSYGIKVMAYSYNGITLYGTGQLFSASMATFKYAAVTLTDNGFFLLGGPYVIPSTVTSRSFSAFGISACTNKITEEKGICAVAIQTTTSVSIMSNSTTNGTFYNYASPIEGSGCDFVLYAPLAGLYSQDVPDDVLRLIIRPDSKQACMENVTLDGKNYVRLGDLLIPE